MAAPQTRTPQNAALPDAIASLQARLEHFYLSGAAREAELAQLRATHPVVMVRPPRPSPVMRVLLRLSGRLRRRRNLRIIRENGLFDAVWYLRHNRDVADAGMDPALHYLEHGGTELRNPGPHFDTSHYLRLYPDIAASGMNPLLHYVLSGHAEARSIRPGMAHGGPA